MTEDKEIILWVGHYRSRCGECGREADPRETTHLNASMVGKGCGAKYTHIASEYATFGAEGSALYEHLTEMRPDLQISSKIGGRF